MRTAAPRTVAASLGVDFLSAIANAVLLVVAGQLLGKMAADETTWTETVPWLIVASAMLAITLAAATYRAEIGRLAVEQLQAHTIGQVLQAASSVPYTSFDSSIFYDRLRRAYESGVSQAWLITQSTLALIKTFVDLGAIFVVLVVVAPELTAIAALAYIPLWFVTAGNTKTLYAFSWDQTEADRRRDYIAETLSRRDTAKEVRIFDMSHALGAQFAELWSDRIDRMSGVVRGRATRFALASLVSAVVIGGALALVVWMTIDGRLSLADAGVGVIGLRQLSNGVGRANVSVESLHRSATYLGDFEAFLDEAEQQSHDSEGLAAPARVEEIRLSDVTFAYPGHERLALKGIDLQLRAGELTAIVGANGSGKTTLLTLLAGLYEPTSGQLTWDGVDVGHFANTSYHQAIAPLFQDFGRFQLTAQENVTLDDHATTQVIERVRRALEMAGATEFIDHLPKGPRTQLGRAFDDGHELSIGQWQRLALARALYRDAPLVLLDEPASALDPIAEADLLGRLREIQKDRCVVFVSHRFASVSRADRILVLDDGLLIEDGTHEELLAANRTYAVLYRAQAEQFAP